MFLNYVDNQGLMKFVDAFLYYFKSFCSLAKSNYNFVIKIRKINTKLIE